MRAWRAGTTTPVDHLKVVYRSSFPKSLVRVFCEETWRFACQRAASRLAKMARPAMLPTVVGLAAVLNALTPCRRHTSAQRAR